MIRLQRSCHFVIFANQGFSVDLKLLCLQRHHLLFVQILLQQNVLTWRKPDIRMRSGVFVPVPVPVLQQLELTGDDTAEQWPYDPVRDAPFGYSGGKQVDVIDVALK